MDAQESWNVSKPVLIKNTFKSERGCSPGQPIIFFSLGARGGAKTSHESQVTLKSLTNVYVF